MLLFAALIGVAATCAEAAQFRLPAEVCRALDQPLGVSLYSLHPNPQAFRWPFNRWFHGYRILGHVPVASPAQRREVAESIKRTARTYVENSKCVFSPRHGVRLTAAAAAYDFVICFECSQMEVFAGDRLVAHISANGSPDVLNRILRSAHIRIAK